MVLGNLPVPGRPSNLADSRARAYCTCSGCGWGLFGHFTLIYRFSLFGRRPDIDWMVGWLFWVKCPFETVFQSISSRLPERGREDRGE